MAVPIWFRFAHTKLRSILFWILLLPCYLTIVTTSVTAASYSILDTEQQWGPSQGDNNGIEPTWERRNEDSKGDDVFYSDLLTDKRALSMLSRWKAFNKAFKPSVRPGRSFINSLMPIADADLQEVETRGLSSRPAGHPLRWGRRR